MPVRSFAIEDGNLNSNTLVVARKRIYKDIDLSFAKRPDGDVYKKQDAAAVKQSVKNLLLTNSTEKPFSPNFGANLNNFLFNLDTEFDADLLEERIIQKVDQFEPRARVVNVELRINGDYHSVTATVTFRILSTNEEDTVELNITRLR
jgi:phage baseplate assembly protein W